MSPKKAADVDTSISVSPDATVDEAADDDDKCIVIEESDDEDEVEPVDDEEKEKVHLNICDRALVN